MAHVDQHDGPVVFAYDGSDQAKAAIREAGRQLRNGRTAIVLTVWEPPASLAAGAPLVPPAGMEEQEAREVAEEGAALARACGFQAEPIVERGNPIWERIVELAEKLDADIVVMGSHGRTGIRLALLGSVAAATARHTDRAVLIAHSGLKRRQ
jgi:nucleotide-binding universal stress UspA family protein